MCTSDEFFCHHEGSHILGMLYFIIVMKACCHVIYQVVVGSLQCRGNDVEGMSYFKGVMSKVRHVVPHVIGGIYYIVGSPTSHIEDMLFHLKRVVPIVKGASCCATCHVKGT